MLGLSIRDLLTYTNVAYLLSLLLTFALTATLWRVSVAAQNESDSALEKYKAEAAVQIAQANGQAASARFETERLKATLKWRTLEPALKARLIDGLRASSQRKVHLAWVFGDPESVWFGEQLAEVFHAAGWIITAEAIPISFTIPFGVSVPLDPALNDEVRGIFTIAGMSVWTYAIPEGSFSIGSTLVEGEATVFVGLRESTIAGIQPQ
jgi:hypothetical protein